MDGYTLVNLNDMLDELGEDACKRRISEFSCPLNLDVEQFLKRSAVVFAQQGISATHLVYTSCREGLVLVGYFTVSIKYMRVYIDKVGKSLGRRARRFAMDTIDGAAVVPALLIGQLGKNYANGYDKLITGDALLKLAMDKVQEVQRIAGSRFVYLECENNQRLIEFYLGNGFVNFGTRALEVDEKDLFTSTELIQMLRYLKA